ncbi:MAG: ABC transporter permease [Rhodobacteraceae bacterium]|nr:MAG: ABC transporter permease [Paracoccaceae bacterium]
MGEGRFGVLAAAPLALVLALGFAAPLAIVMAFSAMPERVFDLGHRPDFSAYAAMIEQGYWRSLLRSLGMALIATVILMLLCWPLAFAMAKLWKTFTLVITIAVVLSLFVSENIRLFGWVLVLMKGGLLDGYLQHWFGWGTGGLVYNPGAIVFGLIYVYFPFMLFPMAQGAAMIPEDARQAAFDLGASRWTVLREIDLPLAAPGIMVGSLLCFVLSAGAIAEGKLLGGRSVITIGDDVEAAFTYAQNWPLGSALAVSLIAVLGGLVVIALGRIDLDRIMGRR